MKIGKPIKYIAVSPSEVIKRVKNKIEDDAKQEIVNVESLRGSEVLNELEQLHLHGVEKIDATELTASIKGRNNLYNHLAELIDKAQERVIRSTTSNGLIRKGDALKKNFHNAKKRGVQIQIVAPLNNDNKELAKELGTFAEIKDADFNSRFLMADGEKITIMLADDKELNANYDTGVHVNSPFFVGSVESMFNDKWRKL